MVVFSCLLTDGGPKYLEQMACSNPVLFYEFAEALARKNCAAAGGEFVELQAQRVIELGPSLLYIHNLLVGPGHPQLLPNWQHYKAYVSAFASWTKALVHLLTTSPSNSLAELTAHYLTPGCEWMMDQSQPFEDKAWGTQDWFSWAATEETKQKPTPSSTQLLLLLLLSRPITAAAWKVLGMKAGPRGRGRNGDHSSTTKSMKQRSSNSSRNSSRGVDIGRQASSSGCGVEARGQAGISGRVEVTGPASSGVLEASARSSNHGGDLEAGGRGIVLEDGAKQNGSSSSGCGAMETSGGIVGTRGSSSTKSTCGDAGGSNGSTTNTRCSSSLCPVGRMPRFST